MGKIKVLIIDDSAVVRKFLTETLSRSRHIEVVGGALDPFIAANKINKLNPDVLTLDIELPRMDGLTFLSKLMISHPMPVIMVSSLTEEGAKATMDALELGAVDFILKPNVYDESQLDSFSDELIDKVIAAGSSKVKRKIVIKDKDKVQKVDVQKKYSADIILSNTSRKKPKLISDTVIAIGASTGGTEAIADIMTNLSEDVPGIVITQHMPEKFTKSFADRINGISKLYVKEAENCDRIYKGIALIAPGDRHMLLKTDTNGYWIEINDGPPVNRHRPSVDVLFRSVAQVASKNSIGIILTGMGSDGAQGLLEIKEAGINTIAQDKESCVIFGMPAEAIKLGAVNMVLSIEKITSTINNFASR